MKRTNMLDELESSGFICEDCYEYGICIHNKKDKGNMYTIINSPFVHMLGSENENYLVGLLAKKIKSYIRGKNIKEIMVVGLGNNRITADALGPKANKNILATRGLKYKYQLSVISPDVYAKTGVETADIIVAISEKIKPDLIIFIDTLSTSNIERMAVSFQLSSEGIIPGSGINYINKKIDKKSTNAECLTIGVPLLVYADDILNDISRERTLPDLILTPKDIDEYVNRCAKIISSSVCSVFIPELSLDEIDNLMV